VHFLKTLLQLAVPLSFVTSAAVVSTLNRTGGFVEGKRLSQKAALGKATEKLLY
jgi:urease accessory protein UreH